MAFRKTQDEKDAIAAQRAEEAFWLSAQGQARMAYQRGDQIFQTQVTLDSHKAVIAPMLGATQMAGRGEDVSADLNMICREGWSFVTAAVAFVQTGSESRDKFLASGQQVATTGNVVGYYVFKRADLAPAVQQ